MMRRALLVLGALLLCHLPGLAAPAAFDDTAGILHNPAARDPGALLQALLHPHRPVGPGEPGPSYAWRPLAEASFLLVPGRWGSLLLHAAFVWAAYRLLGRLLPDAAFWGALWAAVHPVGVYAVTYQYQRSALLAALLGTLCAADYLEGRRWRAWALGFLATLCKESAAALPLLLLGLELVERKPGWVRRWLPFALLPLPLAVQVLRLLPDAPGPTDSLVYPAAGGLSSLDYLRAQVPVVADYIRIHLLPLGLHFNHDRAVLAHPGTWKVLGCAALLAALWLPRARAWRQALVLFLAPLAVESTFFPIRDLELVHRTYASLAGSALAFALLPRGRAPLLLLLAALTLHEQGVWRDPAALLARDLRHAPGLPEARTALGRLRRSPALLGGEPAEAALCLLEQGRAREARDLLLAAGPLETPGLLYAAGRVADACGDPALGAAAARRIAAMPTPTPATAGWLAIRLGRAGDPAGAEAVLLRALSRYPAHARLWEQLGWARGLAGRRAEAAAAFRSALALEPDAPFARAALDRLEAARQDQGP